MTHEADRRAVILAAAERLFALHGLQKTTVAGIAREASVAVGSVYLEFTSKTLIMHELSRAKYVEVLRAMRRAAMAQGSYTLRFAEIMNARTRAFLDIAQCDTHGRELLCAPCDGVREAFDYFVIQQRELLTDFLTSANDDGEFTVADIPQTVQAIGLAYAHFTPPHMAAFPAHTLIPALEAMHHLILHGLRK